MYLYLMGMTSCQYWTWQIWTFLYVPKFLFTEWKLPINCKKHTLYSTTTERLLFKKKGLHLPGRCLLAIALTMRISITDVVIHIAVTLVPPTVLWLLLIFSAANDEPEEPVSPPPDEELQSSGLPTATVSGYLLFVLSFSWMPGCLAKLLYRKHS